MGAALRVLPVLGALLLAVAATWAEEPGRVVTAKSGILIDNQTGQVIWQRQPDLPLPPASTTKVVTAMVALESGRLDDSLWVSKDAARTPASKIHLRAGWRIRVRDLVYAVLLNSANDASVVIAEGLSGSVEEFARRMNRHAQRLGAWNTHFVNPNGLPADNHYSTSRDLATVFGRALENPEFARIVATKTSTIVPAAGSTRAISLRNHNRLLDDYHIHVVGKTGWTRASKKCFVGAGTLGGRRILVAILGSTDLWGDLKTLFAYGFREETGPILEPAQRAAAPTRDSIAASDAWNKASAEASLSTAFGKPTRAGRTETARVYTNEDLTATRSRIAPRTNSQSASRRKADGSATVARAGKSRPYYSVRLGAFSSRAQAERLRATMARKGYKATVVRVRQKKGDSYRVTIGGYRDRGQAQKAAKQIARAHPGLRAVVDG
ncbi:D-alanyl-D-alanine carboxypeptidase [Candidatus Binatia bacterium]|nr:D-alanyl-D-alanine carboxypeptidase [Candidatus Binatia bacterium]